MEKREGKKKKSKGRRAVSDQSGFVGCGSVVFVRVADRIRIESLPIKLIIITAVALKRPASCPSPHISSLDSGLDTKIQTGKVPVANDDNDLAMMTTTIFFFFFLLGKIKRHFS